ncbi:SBBP repeat-containing protein [Luteimonas aquatica]|uniref:DUF7948 domain-containing protein n=1 Tax=Luteimonas aquatica TaxID=450364 RepID=UPI001F582537|nr:SBBP repeat-containing protein [Luteimonas aquatica]
MKRTACVLLAALGLFASLASPASTSPDRSRSAEAFGKLPLHFEANTGQSDPRVRYLARGAGYALFFTDDEAVFGLPAATSRVQKGRPSESRQPASAGSEAVLRASLFDARTDLRVRGEQRLSGTSQYFIGNDPAQWRTGVAQYARLRYSEVYPGVDLVFYGNQQQLEYDFVVAPGADPARIRLDYRGAEAIHLDGEGNLVIRTATGDLVQRRPSIYQDIGGSRREIAGRFVLKPNPGNHRIPLIGFEVASYDTGQPLTIDPVLLYSSYLGGNGYDAATDIRVDGAGNMYLAGYTQSTDFPLWQPLQGQRQGDPRNPDLFLTKLSADGQTLLYSTYLGGSDYDIPTGLSVAADGTVSIAGYTVSNDFPTANAMQPNRAGSYDGFVAQLRADGQRLLFSTYFGGPSLDRIEALAQDGYGNIHVAGWTYGNFPTKNALQPNPGGGEDGFVAMLTPTGRNVVYSTYFGGSGFDHVNDLALDSGGRAHIVGITTSDDLPVANPRQPEFAGETDAFVAKLRHDGSALIYSTYWGGATDHEEGSGYASEYANAIAVDAYGRAYVAGTTNATDFPVRSPLQAQLTCDNQARCRDAFIAKFDVSGKNVFYSTYLGGGNTDEANAVAVDAGGNAYLAGTTKSPDFPTVGALQPLHVDDAFVAKLSPSGGRLLFSTPLGGSGSELVGVRLALDSASNMYVAGATSSADFPLASPFQSTPPNVGGVHAFVSKIGEPAR